ncbi:ABC transporter permease [Phytoactinopolyspora alkaliphila]|uniref:Transport permease protein n=1 Tax=Phytoactinopolyspora alkaliphila TaxID=1783498 RepID=A0A6N9YG73_9ACTN|nr:ABC transporter permease [Phytoactinopolyspora alkaliphila]NED93930.1 ABC transporter permease [Phytoactinopolyspora alkaliphila]
MIETSTHHSTETAGRPADPWRNARHSLILARRSLVKTRRNPGELIDALLLPVVFLLMFVYLFGGAVAGSTSEYLQYVFPGILIMTTVLAGLLATGLNISIDIKKGVFDRFRSLPISRSAPLIGSVLGDAVRYVVAVVTVFAVAYAMGFRVETSLVSAIGASALGITLGFCLSWLTVLIGVAIRQETVVTSVAFLGIFPLTFGTDMVAPKETMPGWLQAWVDVNPMTHAMEASRGLLLGGPVAESVTATLVWSAGFLVVFGVLATHVYRRRATGQR